MFGRNRSRKGNRTNSNDDNGGNDNPQRSNEDTDVSNINIPLGLSSRAMPSSGRQVPYGMSPPYRVGSGRLPVDEDSYFYPSDEIPNISRLYQSSFVTGSVHGGLKSLISTSGISLDGQSLMLPPDDVAAGMSDFADEVSSLNSSICRPMTAYATSNNEATRVISLSPPRHPHCGSNTDSPDSKKREIPIHIAALVRPGSGTASTEAPISLSDSSVPGKFGTFCCPLWLRNAPTLLKVLLVFCTCLFVAAGASMLVGVTVMALGQDPTSSNSAVQQDGQTISGTGETASFTLPPVSSSLGPFPLISTLAPTPSEAIDSNEETGDAIGTLQPTASPTAIPTMKTLDTPVPTMKPITRVTRPPTQQPTAEPTLDNSIIPTKLLDRTVLTIYATAGRSKITNLDTALQKLPDHQGTSFLLHLGDWNSQSETGCSESSFQQVSTLYRNSAMPVYFTIGDNEYNDCPNPKQALSLWKKYLMDFAAQYWPDPSWTVWRQGSGYSENYVFGDQDSQTVFCGINLVGGDIYDPTEFQARQQANLDWIDENYQFYRKKFAIFVLIAHAAPPGYPNNEDFYNTLMDRIKKKYSDMYFVLIHKNSTTQDYGITDRYSGLNNLSVISVLGPVWPPMQIQFDHRNKVPVDVNLDTWYKRTT